MPVWVDLVADCPEKSRLVLRVWPYALGMWTDF